MGDGGIRGRRRLQEGGDERLSGRGRARMLGGGWSAVRSMWRRGGGMADVTGGGGRGMAAGACGAGRAGGRVRGVLGDGGRGGGALAFMAGVSRAGGTDTGGLRRVPDEDSVRG